ncbi:MAG: hypothetical protein IJV94_01820 [Bacilli bacterium]|nr:hypothetical protein [Bacilli bacterium]
MSKFIKDALLVLLMFFVFAGVFMKTEDDNQQQISSDIEDFDDLVNGGDVVEDGFLEDNETNYEGNAIAKGVLKTGEIFINILNKGIDLVISLVKKALD